MPITPLPQFEADLAEYEREKRIDALVEKGFGRSELEAIPTEDLIRFERKAPPRTLVVRFGSMKLIGEYPYRGDVTPGCGSKVVVKTHRGTELGEMLTSTCPNAGCSKSISRKEMLEYVENSGGRDYPFFTGGRVLRVATPEDMDHQAKIEQSKHELRSRARDLVQRIGAPVKVVDAEPVLGGERVTYYVTSEERVDLRALQRDFLDLHRCRVDVRHVGARDEARLTADYEKCGQYCCCKNFLKVLRPISMRSAKTQKATLDPIKISGRCGRLMCCLRYEDATYEELKKNLPRNKSRVGTPEGDGTVIETQILTQLALVELDSTRERKAYPIEELAPPGEKSPPSAKPAQKPESREAAPARRKRRPKPAEQSTESQSAPEDAGEASKTASTGPTTDAAVDPAAEPVKKKRRRRRRRSRSAENGSPPTSEQAPTPPAASSTESEATPTSGAQGGEPAKKKRRRRRRRRPGSGPDGGAGDAPGGDSPSAGPGPES